MNKKRVIVVCPGRGSYTRETSGYLAKYGKFRKDEINWMDKKRRLNPITDPSDATQIADFLVFFANIF